MKKYLFVVLALVLAISLVGCNNEEVTKENDKNIGAADIVGMGKDLYDTSKDISQSAADDMDTMMIEMVRNQFDRYAGEKVKGLRVRELISVINDAKSNETFPVDIEMVFEGGMTEETIEKEKYYSVVFEDRLPEKKQDGYYDLVTISLLLDSSDSSLESGE